jgi:hypothetical protein
MYTFMSMVTESQHKKKYEVRSRKPEAVSRKYSKKWKVTKLEADSRKRKPCVENTSPPSASR